MRTFYLLCLAFLLGTVVPTYANGPIKPVKAQGVHFIQNQKQWEAETAYRANIPGGFLHVRKGGHLLYSFYDVAAVHKHLHPHSEEEAQWAKENPEILAHGVAVDFLGSRPEAKARPVFGHILPYRYNYFRGKDPAKWSKDVLATRSLQVEELYTGIDMKLLGKGNAFKYEFIVKPQADPNQVVMHYRGASDLEITKEGHLLVHTALHEYAEQKPFVYQLSAEGDTLQIAAKYTLNKDNEVRFKLLEKYNPDLPLIIDPLVVFSTFSGSFSAHWGNTATYDAAGNLYAGGTIFGNDFPATVGVFRSFFSGDSDATIMKYNSDGSSLLYATFLGGRFADVPHSLVVNNAGNLVIFGTTGSDDFPIRNGAFDINFNGGAFYDPWGGGSSAYRFGTDCFVSIISRTGNNLINSTYLGGSGNDGVNEFGGFLTQNYGDQLRGEVVVDNNDNVYIASMTQSPDFPLRGGLATGFARQMGVVCKFTPTLSNLVWSTYLGGNGTDAAYAIRVAQNGDVYVAGGTGSASFGQVQPTGHTPGVLGGANGFLVALDVNGAPKYGTYISGGLGYDQAYLLDLDEQGRVYVMGQTRNGNSYPPVPNNVYYNQGGGIFVRRYNPQLSQVTLSTLIGSGSGAPNISPTAFMVNSCDNIYIAGWGGVNNGSYSQAQTVTGMPTTSDAFRRTTTGDDFYFAVLSADAQSLAFATFYGDPTSSAGDHVDGGTSRFDPVSGEIYHSACACTTSNFPTTPGAHSNTNNSSNCNNAAFKIAFEALEADFETYDDFGNFGIRSGCAPFRFGIDNRSFGATDFNWSFDDGNTSTQVDSFYHTFTDPGTYRIKLIASNPLLCNSEDSAFLTIEVFPQDFDVNGDTTICIGESVQLQATGSRSYFWTPAAGLSSQTASNPTATPTQTTTYSVAMQNQFGCEDTLQVTVEVIDDLNADFDFELVGICNEIPQLRVTDRSSGDPTDYLWDFGNGQTSTSPTPDLVNFDNPGTYTVTLQIGKEPCTASVEKEIEVFENSFYIMPDTTLCAGQSVQLIASGGISYAWTPEATLDDPTSPRPIASPSETTIYNVLIQGNGGCELDTSVTVTVLPEVLADFEVEFGSRCDQLPVITITNNSKNASSFFWDFGNGETSTEENPEPFEYEREGQYTIVLRVGNGVCSDTAAVTINVEIDRFTPFLDDLRVPEDLTICAGDTVQLFAALGEVYTWSPATGLSDPNISDPLAFPAQTTRYEVRIANADGGCFIDTAVTVNVQAAVSAEFTATTSAECGAPPVVRIENLTENADAYLWIMGNGDTLTTAEVGSYEYEAGGEYTITLRALNGICTDEFSRTINVQNINPPNVITPNNDGKNDRFVVGDGAGAWKLSIFDRWGKEVFQSDDYQNDWGGDASGTVYYYELTSPSGKSCKGWLHVLR